MPKDKKTDEPNNIIHFTRDRIQNKDPELQTLVLEWEEFGYSKFSSIEDQMEWSIMEVLLIDDFDLHYVGSSGIDYPSISSDDIDEVRRVVATAKKARSLLNGFKLPQRESNESLRPYQARVSDRLEMHLISKMDQTDASLVADFYLVRCINDPPLGYDE